MNNIHSILNPSSLLDLKAELHKKYESLRQAKQNKNPEFSKPTRYKNKNEPIVKNKKNVLEVKPEESNEEELALQKSRVALEAKAKLYEKLASSTSLIDDEENEHFLVDFQRKFLYSPLETEMCETNSDNTIEKNHLTSHELNPVMNRFGDTQPMSINADFTEEKSSDQPLHYQNVQYNEVRDHGTAYFSFSTDEAQRKEQMEELNTLRQETEEQRMMKQRLQRKRKAMLQSRLTKVCERRNIDKNVVETFTAMPNNSDAMENNLPCHIDLSSIPLPDGPEISEKKEPKIRPWDIGKPDLHLADSRKHKTMTQKDWVEQRRHERPTEFSPPVLY